MKIELNGQIFIAPRPKARVFRNTLQLLEEKDLNNLNTQMLDDLVDYIADVFQKQFTANDIYDEYYSDELIELFKQTIEFVMGNQVQTQDVKKKITEHPQN